jgi:uncharacterized membrane protein YkvI
MSKNKGNSAGVTAFGIASTYVGAIIGAGYASGQEILQFFNAFYEKGLIGILVATILFIVAAYVPMMLGNRLKCGDYDKVVSLGKSKFPQIFCDVIITFTLFSTLTIMIAASGATFNQSFGTPLIVGGIVMSVLMIVSLLAGLDGIVKALSAVVPIMVIGAFGTAFYFIANPAPVLDATKEIIVNSSPLIKHWSLSGVLYVAFNYVVAVAVMISLGQQAKDVKAIRNGALYGGLVLGLCAFALYTALSKNLHIVGTSDLPLVDLANSLSTTFGSLYSIILFAGLYSTAISCFFGVYQRFAKVPALSKLGNNTIIITISVVALIASMIGFSSLIGYVYPAIGYCGVVILIMNAIKLSKLEKVAEVELEEEFQKKEKLATQKNHR